MNGERRRLWLALAGGLAVFAIGAALALSLLPEWRAGRPADPGLYERELRRIAARAGLPLSPGRPAVTLATDAGDFRATYGKLGEGAAGWLESTRRGVRVRVRQGLRRPGLRSAQELRVDFSLDGRPWAVVWENPNSALFGSTDRAPFERLGDSFASLLVAPGESLGPPMEGRLTGSPATWKAMNFAGAAPPQTLMIGITPPQSVFADREAGWVGSPGSRPDESVKKALLSGLLWLPLALAVVGIFLSLLLRSRIDLVNGAALGLVALLSASPRWLSQFFSANPWVTALGWTFEAPGRAVAILLTWSAGESLLRAVRPDFTTSLDTLRHGRLGPRGGRALLVGFAAGAALAGLTLAGYALAAALPGVSPAAPSVNLPLFRLNGGPILDGIWLAAGVTLALALAVRFLPARAAAWGAALLAGYAVGPLALFPYPVELAANVAFAGLLVWICRRFGLTALLAAAVTLFVLPSLLASGLYLAWMPGAFALMAGLTAGLVGLGFAGLSRPETVETERIPPPPFMRRLAEERRVRHEVDLLARMQIGLLPREMPRLAGYEIAARSVLASEAGGDLYDFLRDEAGGLWIAAGDVAGHGYSCAVAQAMVKAGLLSLVSAEEPPEESPDGVLRQLDRVLRDASADHHFTSLALIRLDPATGDAVLANAGYPYPLVLSGGRVAEVELPGLPLGRGPAHGYAGRGFQLPAGGVLLLCSDGLSEALDRNGNAYGFERAREVLRVMGHRPALEIVDALLNDCRRHLGAEPAPDDVTVVVVKRA
jgi:sigma-B regulation protein RsbU (phosphoserine phosphatase)